jgi:hypothetical protein
MACDADVNVIKFDYLRTKVSNELATIYKVTQQSHYLQSVDVLNF